MSTNNKENARMTIADLVAQDDAESSSFFQNKPGDRKQKHVDHASEGSEIIPVLKLLRDADMLVPGSNLSPGFFDEYRRIKRPILSNAFGKTAKLVDRGNLVLVTSSLPGEGKTHSAINLALSIAQERDHTVLLVDCDVTRRGVSHLLGISERPGLVDVLEDDNLALGNVLLRTDIHQFSVLGAGRHHEFVTELLASQRMSMLVDEMAARYDDRIIIFDGPPLLPTPQTHVLAGHVGQVIFVIEAGKTPQSVVEEAIEMIPEEKAMGVIMNKAEGVSARQGYYYGYYGSDQDKDKG